MSRGAEPTTRASPLLYNWGKDFQVIAFITLTLSLFRIVLITTFHQQSESFTLSNLLSVLGTGFRYDIAVAAVWIVPTLMLALLLPLLNQNGLLQKLRSGFLQLYIILAIPFLGADIVFFGEFGDQFNMRIFGLIHDDTEAILITIWKEYNPIPFLLLSIFIIWIVSRIGSRWLNYDINWRSLFMRPLTEKRPLRIAIYFGCFILFLAMMRGGLLWGEPMRLKYAFVTDDIFLNRTVINPISSLRFTLQEKMQLDSDKGLNHIWPGGDIHKAASAVYSQRHNTPQDSAPKFDNLDELLLRTTTGSTIKRPKHIFLLLQESHSGWTILPQYRDLEFSPLFSEIAAEGIYFPNFLASGNGTIRSLNAFFTGMPDVGLNINYELESTQPYATGIGTIMKQIGYKTRLFYGGYLSWERLDSFSPNQGFDELHGGGKMSRGGKETNEWGVDDKRLYEYIEENIDPDVPSFNFILTTTNHPPFDIDLEAEGFPMKELPSEIEATKNETLTRLGHIWYADRQAGQFVKRANEKFRDALFTITADHTARAQVRFPGNNLIEPIAVPLIIYGPDLLDGAAKVMRQGGSHIDITPTLVNLVAPKGHRFSSFGMDLFQKRDNDFALGDLYIIGDSFIKGESPNSTIRAIDDSDNIPSEASVATSEHYFKALKALSWWRTKRGAELPP
ncbi:MAG: LTA synthase family protein [Gammaproteobacteria bacterium]|nr:LTA synthase family protein [Gammaproteobacteria bacterium]